MNAMFDANFNDTFIDAPLDEYVILQRNPDGLSTNVPHLIVQYSMTGYDWGNDGGDGAYDLALNIVEHLLRATGFEGRQMMDTWSKNQIFAKSWFLHEAFNLELVARMPQEGGKLYVNDLIIWIQEHLCD
jgi:hypothetical protein